ncbi:TraX family protein [Anaerocolumna xylanovorans]|uniref:TraX protein n=1 Tax=Anaerocolumna xylanovorans DSM 12503 TaxID=1121345 RepID=A0A1M7YEM9_9FIRM|nr:TraX family protein [Anaerocolumna xylanovorans]SHO50958.1 TraX protein [Anaerocolumna xylanovorans DSM 12503]
MEDIRAVPSFPEEKIRKRGIPGSTLKLIAIFTMLIDHTAAVILEQILVSRGFFVAYSNASFDSTNIQIYQIYEWMRNIGRIAFPIFCFLLVEGFRYTSNKRKYAIRLGLFALVSEIPFDLAFYERLFYSYHQNVFFTLLIGFLVIWGFQLIGSKLRDRKWLPLLSAAGAAGAGWIAFTSLQNGMYTYNTFMAGFTGEELSSVSFSMEKNAMIGTVVVVGAALLTMYLVRSRKEEMGVFLADCAVLAAGMLLADFLNTDYSGFGVLTIAVIYALRRNPVSSGVGGYIVLNVMSLSELAAIFALVPIALYNGERGLKLKYIFYAFYPVHLFILYLICRAMNII